MITIYNFVTSQSWVSVNCWVSRPQLFCVGSLWLLSEHHVSRKQLLLSDCLSAAVCLHELCLTVVWELKRHLNKVKVTHLVYTTYCLVVLGLKQRQQRVLTSTEVQLDVCGAADVWRNLNRVDKTQRPSHCNLRLWFSSVIGWNSAALTFKVKLRPNNICVCLCVSDPSISLVSHFWAVQRFLHFQSASGTSFTQSHIRPTLWWYRTESGTGDFSVGGTPTSPQSSEPSPDLFN